MNQSVSVEVRHGAGHTVVAVCGRVFFDTVDPLREALTPLLADDHPRVVLDLSQMEICDSSGLSLITDGHHAAVGQGGWLRIAGLQPMVRRVVEVTNLDGLLSIHPTVDDAVRA